MIGSPTIIPISDLRKDAAGVIKRAALSHEPVFMTWAREGGYVVLTSELGFSALLATNSATGPRVIQVRTQDVFPESLGAQGIRVLLEQSDALESGAIITIDEIAARVRILPIRRLPGSEGPG